MIKLIISFLIVIAASSSTYNRPTAISVLKLTFEELNHFKRLAYTYTYEHMYYSMDDSFKAKADIYYDFTRSDSIINLSYQINNENVKMIFNGTEAFTLNKKDSTMNLIKLPSKDYFKRILFHSNSLITLLKVLPIYIDGKETCNLLNDTTIKNNQYYQILLTPIRKGIDPMGTFSPFTIDRNVTYKLLISKENYLPFKIIQTFSDNNDYQITTFRDFKTPDAIDDFEWYYSSYTNKYKINLPKVSPPLIGVEAPEWTLFDALLDGKKHSLKDYQNTVVLINFWIHNCGYCINSIPKLNELLKKHGSKGLKIIGINSYDSKQSIMKFIDRYQPEFPNSINGEKVAKLYGVTYFPTIIIVDKNRKIKYAGIYEDSAIEQCIAEIFK